MNSIPLKKFLKNICKAKPQTHTIGILLIKKTKEKKSIFVFKKIISGIYRTNYNILGKYRTIKEPFKKKSVYRTMFCIQNRMAALYSFYIFEDFWTV